MHREAIHGKISAMPHSPRYAPHRPWFRRAGLIGTLLLAVLALTGCVTVQLKATVHSDDTVSGTARIGIAKAVANLGGSSALAELKSQNACDFGGKGGTSKDFDDGTYVGVDCSFNNVTLAEFNSGNEGPRLTHEGGNFHLTGSMNLFKSITDGSGGLLSSGSASGPVPTPSGLPTDLSSLLPSGFPTDLSSLLPSGFPTDLSSLLPSGFPTDLSSLLPSGLPTDLSSLLPSGLPSTLPSNFPTDLPSGFPDLSNLLKTAKISFAFTFPGKVSASKGKVAGKTVTFTPDSSGNIDFETTASAKDSGGLTGGLGNTAWIGLVVLVLIVLALVALLLRRRNRQAAQPAFAGGYPAQPGYPGYQGQPGYPGEQYQGEAGYPGQQYQGQPGYPGQEYPSQPPQTQPYQPADPAQYQPPQPTQPYQPPQATQPPQGQPYYQGQPYRPDGPPPRSYQPPPDEPNPWGPPPPNYRNPADPADPEQPPTG